MDDIPQYASFTTIKPVREGLSGDRKYRVETPDGARLLRITDAGRYELRARDYRRMRLLYEAGVPMPKTIAFGLCEEGKSVYTLLEWIEGSRADRANKALTPAGQYDLGLAAGRALRRIHTVDDHFAAEDWSGRYFAVMDGRFEAYRREGLPFEGSEACLDFIQSNKGLLKDRPQCCHHGDFHLGNLIITPDGRLCVIDWHSVDFGSYGDPYFEFNRIDPAYPAFAAGQIDGYFDGEPPGDFWPLLKYYTAASNLTAIVWAKYSAPRELDFMLRLNAETVRAYEGMKSDRPLWYKSYK